MKKSFTAMFAVIMIFTAACASGNTSQYNSSLSNTDISHNAEAESKTCSELVDVVLDSVEFPATIEVSDSDILTETIGLNLQDIDEYRVVQQMMSVSLVEVIVVKAKDGKTDAVLKTLENRKEKIQNELAFYPEQQESAAGAVTGATGNYVYLIAHKDGNVAEKKLLESIN